MACWEMDEPLLLSAMLENIEVEGVVEDAKRSYYSVSLYVENNKVARSTKSKPQSSVVKWEWKANNQIWFEPSTTVKIELYRGYRYGNILKVLVGRHEGKVVDLLENGSTSFDLTDKEGILAAKMKIVLSCNSRSGNTNVEEFMKKVAVGRMPVGRLPNNLLTLGHVLKLSKSIMDRFSQVHPMLNASWTIVSCLYQAIKETDLQDDFIRELAGTLRDMLTTANMIPDLPVIRNTTDVIVDISRQSLWVASLIYEYKNLSLTERTFKLLVGGDLKSRIDKCQRNCASLKDSFNSRLHIDSNYSWRANDMLADKIRQWLAAPDNSRNKNEARDNLQVDTCAWFLEGERFCVWQENPGFIWIKGKAGCGKSVLCSSIFDKLPEATESIGIAYFFFDGRDSQKELQLHSKLIRTLISQLSDTRHGAINEKLAALYKYYGEVQQPSDEQLQNVLRDILHRFSQVYIVIDALEKCTNREKTLNWVNRLISDKAANLHIVITSRPETDINEIFTVLDPHPIDVGEANTKDIVEYLKLQMESKFTKYDESTRAKIISELEKHAEGSFRWVILQLAELEKCSSQYEIDKQLAELPKGPDNIYNRNFENIDRTHHADTRKFLAFCKRPMTQWPQLLSQPNSRRRRRLT